MLVFIDRYVTDTLENSYLLCYKLGANYQKYKQTKVTDLWLVTQLLNWESVVLAYKPFSLDFNTSYSYLCY